MLIRINSSETYRLNGERPSWGITRPVIGTVLSVRGQPHMDAGVDPETAETRLLGAPEGWHLLIEPTRDPSTITTYTEVEESTAYALKLKVFSNTSRRNSILSNMLPGARSFTYVDVYRCGESVSADLISPGFFSQVDNLSEYVGSCMVSYSFDHHSEDGQISMSFAAPPISHKSKVFESSLIEIRHCDELPVNTADLFSGDAQEVIRDRWRTDVNPDQPVSVPVPDTTIAASDDDRSISAATVDEALEILTLEQPLHINAELSTAHQQQTSVEFTPIDPTDIADVKTGRGIPERAHLLERVHLDADTNDGAVDGTLLNGFQSRHPVSAPLSTDTQPPAQTRVTHTPMDIAGDVPELGPDLRDLPGFLADEIRAQANAAALESIEKDHTAKDAPLHSPHMNQKSTEDKFKAATHVDGSGHSGSGLAESGYYDSADISGDGSIEEFNADGPIDDGGYPEDEDELLDLTVPPGSVLYSERRSGRSKVDEYVDIYGNEAEESLYELVWREVESGSVRPGLWAKAFAASGGDESKTKAQYISIRVEELASNKLNLTDLSNAPNSGS